MKSTERKTAIERMRSLPDIHSVGVAIYDPIWSQRWHATRHAIELLHVLKGHLYLVMPGRRLSAGPGDTLFVPTGVLHRDEFDLKSGLEVFMVFFRWKAEKEFFKRVGIQSLLSMPASRKAEISMILDRLRSDISGGGHADRAVACARLMTVLTLMWKNAEERKTGNDSRKNLDVRKEKRRLLMHRAWQYLEQRYAEPITLDGIAHMLGVSPYYLSHVFSEESDFSLFAYLTTLRMEKARSLLAERQFSVKQVAHAVGYDDPNYFSRVFRRHFGFPPHATQKLPVFRPRFPATKSSK